jgi:hypothetical protein
MATGVVTARVSYAVEYTDRAGRRRRQRKSTLMGALKFKRRLRMGSNPQISVVTRKARA